MPIYVSVTLEGAAEYDPQHVERVSTTVMVDDDDDAETNAIRIAMRRAVLTRGLAPPLTLLECRRVLQTSGQQVAQRPPNSNTDATTIRVQRLPQRPPVPKRIRQL